MLHQDIARLATEYSRERTKQFSQNPFGEFVRHDLAISAKKHIMFLPFDLTVKASVGAGVWAAIPWLGFFDPLITDSATYGFYVVYLINPDSQMIYLSLNQGTTRIYEEYGEDIGQQVLRRRANDMADRVKDFSRYFDRREIDLGSSARLPKGYTAGHAFGRAYDARSINREDFSSDLEKMLYAYERLIDLGGTTPIETMQEEAPGKDINETRRFILSRRIERSPKVRPLVLERRGAICEGCGFDPFMHTTYGGTISNTPLDVHHAAPLHSLAEGESRRYKIPDDFLVLCPTCHRLIHKQDNPANLEGLKDSLRFILTKKPQKVT